MSTPRAYHRLLWPLFLFCFTGFTSRAQHFYIQKYTVNDGLSDSYVLNMQQDSEGFLWIGTINGLSRFDGKEFINYGYTEGLPSLRVDQVFEDHAKRMWAGTRRGVVEIKGRKCIGYPLSDSLPITYVFGIKELADNTLVTMTDKGVYRFEQNRWVKWTLYPGMENKPCRNMLDVPGGLLINYGERVVLRSKDGRYSLPGPVNANKLYYNTLSYFHKKQYLHLSDRVLQINGTDTIPLFTRRLHPPIGGFFIDSKDRCWVTTEQDGIQITAPGDPTRVTDTLHTTYNLVSSIYEDREGNIWIGCIDGLMKLSDVNYTLYTPANDIRNIIKTGPGIVACSGSGLLAFRQGMFRPTVVQQRVPGHPPFADIVDGWCEDGRGRTWFITRERSLYLLEHDTIRDVSQLVSRPPKDIYWQIAFSRKNNKVYLCSDSLFVGDDHGLKLFRAANTGEYIVRPRSVYYFDNGQLLVHTSNDAFLLLDAQDRVRNVSAEIDIKGPNEGVFMYAEPDGRFWIAYNGGLVRLRWNEQQLPVKELTLTARDGLPNDAVHNITTDAFHRLWVLTRSGLAVIEPGIQPGRRPVVHRLSEETGIYCNQWIEARLLTDAGGLVWMSLQNGVYRFDPARLSFDNSPPAANIEDIQLNLHPTRWSEWTDSLYGYGQLPRQATLPYYLNSLSISYKAPCFRGTSGIEYSYQLEGADSGWSPATKNSSVSFVKLPPANYTFKVRARKSNTDWGAPASFVFIIQPPYWERWWFKALILVLATMLLTFIFRSRIRQVRRKAQVREQLRELELKALRAQMNPHFIYNALNSIQALVFSNKPEEASLYISKFGRLLRQVLNHSEKGLVPLQEELEALELYIQLEQLRLHVDLHYSIHPDPAIDAAEEWVPPLVLQPFAENALWHGLSRKEGIKTLDISITATDDWLIIQVTDNGIGRRMAAGNRPARARNGSRGMDITGRRLQEYNRIRDTVFIEVSDLTDAAGHASGTSVLLRIKRKTGAAV